MASIEKFDARMLPTADREKDDAWSTAFQTQPVAAENGNCERVPTQQQPFPVGLSLWCGKDRT
jgi:hypothetical protein